VAWGAPLIRWSDDGAIVLAARPIASLLAGLSPAGMAASLAQWCCWLCRLCDDISEFESYMPCHAVRSLPANVPARLERQAGMLDGAGRSICGAELPRACARQRLSPFATCTATVAFRYLWCREPELVRWEGQCMRAVGEPRKRPHYLMCFGYGGD
jgi:hypothetical protein